MPEVERKRRIAICHPDLGIGGAERLIVDAAVELSLRGHDVHIFTAHHDPNRCFDETKDGKIPVTVYGDFIPRHIFYKFHALFAYIRCIYVALCMIWLWPSFDVILCDQVSAVIPVFKSTSSKVVFYCHFPDLLLAKHTSWLRKLYRKPIDWLEEKTTGMADCVLVNSKFTASTFASTFTKLHSRGSGLKYFTQLSTLINSLQFQHHRLLQKSNIQCPFSSSVDVYVFLSINRFERKKNIELAISAFALLIDHERRGEFQNLIDQEKLKLVVAGGYDERLKENREYLMEIKELSKEKDVLDHVVFLPSCSTAQRDSLLASCLGLIYTPTDEHFGIVPLEAMAASKPVIACNSGGPKESVVHNVTGFLCEPTPQNFSSAMNILLRDPELATKMGRSAKDHVKESFSRHVFGENLNKIILNVSSHL